MSTLLESDAVTGIVRRFHSDSADENFTITREQDVTEIINRNKREFASVDERARWGTRTLVARIPMVLMADLMLKGIPQDDKAFGRWLDDPDNRVFRTRPGSIGAMQRTR